MRRPIDNSVFPGLQGGPHMNVTSRPPPSLSEGRRAGVSVASFGVDGKQAEEMLDRVGITVNKQVIPDDPRPPMRPSGIRVGTPACTTRGMVELDMRRIAGWMVEALRHRLEAARLARLASEVREYCIAFPVPGLDSRPSLRSITELYLA
jgi:glycine hydroxymethyltransferase